MNLFDGKKRTWNYEEIKNGIEFKHKPCSSKTLFIVVTDGHGNITHKAHTASRKYANFDISVIGNEINIKEIIKNENEQNKRNNTAATN